MAKKDKDAPVEGEEQPKSKKKLLIIVALVVVLLGGGGGGYFFLAGGSGEKPAPVPGAVVRLDSININLAAGHYLKVGLALQVIEGPAHEPDGAHALDLMIAKLSQRSVAELSSNAAREKVKKELLHDIEEAYHGDVMDIYFTEFVMQ